MNSKKSLRTIKIILPSFIAIALFFFVAMSSAFQTSDKVKVKVDQPILWELRNPNADVTDPNSYVPYPGNESDCEGDQEICVIKAPKSSGLDSIPAISAVPSLMDDLEYFQEFHDASNDSQAVWYKN